MSDQEVESCGCVDEECTGGKCKCTLILIFFTIRTSDFITHKASSTLATIVKIKKTRNVFTKP